MRHHKGNKKLGMMTSHRKAMLRNMARSLITYEKIETTARRAKEVRKVVERLITLGKTDSVVSRRHAYDVLSDRDLVMRLFKDIAPLFNARKGGYTRIIPLGFRRGDGAQMVILELTERKIIEKLPKKKKEKKQEASDKKHVEPETGAQEHKAQEHKKQEEPKIRAVPKSKPTLAEEKSRERAKSEDKKVAGSQNFMKNLRGLFRKRGDR